MKKQTWKKSCVRNMQWKANMANEASNSANNLHMNSNDSQAKIGSKQVNASVSMFDCKNTMIQKRECISHISYDCITCNQEAKTMGFLKEAKKWEA